MKRSPIFLLLISSVLVFSSCRDIIDIEVPVDNNGKLTVDGVFYLDTFPVVNLTLSQPYNATTNYPTPQGAIVTLSDGQLTETLEEKPLNSGHFAGKLISGDSTKTYTLTIKWNGQTYTSVNRFPRAGNAVDSSWYEEITQIRASQRNRYILYFNVQERPGLGDNYLFQFFWNDSLDNSPGAIDIRSDQFVDGNYLKGATASRLYAKGDTAKVVISSISQACYNFYNEITNNTVSQNGLFTPPPAPIKGNVSGALGFFRLSWRTEFTRIIR